MNKLLILTQIVLSFQLSFADEGIIEDFTGNPDRIYRGVSEPDLDGHCVVTLPDTALEAYVALLVPQTAQICLTKMLFNPTSDDQYKLYAEKVEKVLDEGVYDAVHLLTGAEEFEVYKLAEGVENVSLFEQLQTFTKESLEKVAAHSTQFIEKGVFGNCGSVSKHRYIFLDHEPRTGSTTLKQAFLSNQLPSSNVSISEIKYNKKDVTKAATLATQSITGLTEKTLENATQAKKEAYQLLFDLLSKATSKAKDRKVVSLYKGSASGDFSYEAGIMGIRDSSNYELMVVAEGYCE